jgi:hypothetical protein
MKHTKIAIQLVCAAALAALFPACSTTDTTSGSSTGTSATVSQTVAWLSQSGFRPYSAKTAAQKAHIQGLPADKLTKVNRHGTNMWVYPDAANNQIYVGNSAQYNAFRALRKSRTGLDSEEDLVTSFNTRGGTPVEIYDGFVPMNALDH